MRRRVEKRMEARRKRRKTATHQEFPCQTSGVTAGPDPSIRLDERIPNLSIFKNHDKADFTTAAGGEYPASCVKWKSKSRRYYLLKNATGKRGWSRHRGSVCFVATRFRASLTWDWVGTQASGRQQKTQVHRSRRDAAASARHETTALRSRNKRATYPNIRRHEAKADGPDKRQSL